jgi:diguanylate cyclase (GGDEF)-like protein
MQATTSKDSVYRLGGDEFLIVCKHVSEEEVKKLVENIRSKVSETKYSCAIGYSFCSEEIKNIDEIMKKSDEMMYKDKLEYYSQPGHTKYRG